MTHGVMQSGQTIAGKYRLNQPIGAGGMASVWSATNVFTERHFAIKFLHPNVAKTPEAAHRFLMEAKVSARVNHPNIIEIIDVGQTEDGALFMVMELLQGVSLETAIRRQSPPMLLCEFIGVMIDVSRALAAAHRSGVVHRDLKPTNVYLHMIREGVAVPKLLDFGVSKFTEETNHALTVAGTVLGSPLYMSPEQAMGMDDIDGRTDIFAFGAILFEALAGCRPYEAANFNALLVSIATTQPKSIDKFAPHMPEPLRAIVRACLVTDRKKRIASFDEITDQLLNVLPELEQSGLRLPSKPTTGPTSDPDATNALPILREQQGPPPPTPGVHLSEPPGAPSGASPPAAFASPYQGPLPDQGASTVIRSPPVVLFVGLGAFITLAAVVIAWFVARSIAPPLTPTAATLPVPPRKPAPAAPAAEPMNPSIEISDPPVVPIDSLPVATAPAAAQRPTGARLIVTASPGWCMVTIDGQLKGPTPLPTITLPAGPHTILCTPPNGRPHTMTMTATDGAASRYRFNLADAP